MLISEKYFILPILCRYWLRNIAVAIHISKNEDSERASNVIDNDSLNGNPPKFVTYEVIGYGFTSDIGALKRYESRYTSETIRLTAASAKDMVYTKIT
jgi:hypothetical protein